MKPVSFRKSNAGRTVGLAKTATASEAIPEIRPGSDALVVSFGQFSIVDVLARVVDLVGPCDVTLATWSAADADLQRSAEMIEAAAIRSFRLIVDRTFATRQPGYCAHMRSLFGPECVTETRCHAKFALVRNEHFDVVIRTSMNMNSSPRMECVEVCENRGFAEWLQGVADSICSDGDQETGGAGFLQFPELPADYPFRLLDAPAIPRESLSEASATHTMRRL